MIVFRPFRGEIVLGKVSGGTEKGIKSTHHPAFLQYYISWIAVGVEFFNDILVPPNLLFSNTQL